jgi:6-phosphogluconolactonase
MKALSLLLTLFTVFALARPATADQHLYLAAGDRLTVFKIDAQSGKLQPAQEIELPGAGPMTASPDKRFLYITATAPGNSDSKKAPPAIATFKVLANGLLEQVATAPVNLRPGYLMTDAGGRYLAGNHYGPGQITLWKLEDHLYQGETAQEVPLEEKTHSTVFAPNDDFLLVPATGPNKVFQLRFDSSTGQLVPNDPPFATGPTGDNDARQPRHLVFHPNQDIVYTTNERELPGVGVWSWDAGTGTLNSIQNIPTQPEGFDGTVTTADLHLTPDQKFLYVSNRNTTDKTANTGNDSIVAFSVDSNDGRLTKLGHFPCEHLPRSFAIDESGRFLYVAGQGDDRLGAYRIDVGSGDLEKIDGYSVGKRPSWVHCMTPPAP